MNNALLALNIVSCFITLGTAVFGAVNHMTRDTNIYVRVAWICIATGAFGYLTGLLYGAVQASPQAALTNFGIALLSVDDRRRNLTAVAPQ